MQFATLAHSIWFRAPLWVDEWFLCNQAGGRATGGRALSRGEIFDRSGRLCATTMREGLIRPRRPLWRSE